MVDKKEIVVGSWKITERENESSYLDSKFIKSVQFSAEMIKRICPDVTGHKDFREAVFKKLGVEDLLPKPKVEEVKTDVITMSVSEAIAQTKAWLNAKEKASVKKSFIREKLLKAGFSETDIMSIMPESHKAYAKETINLFD